MAPQILERVPIPGGDLSETYRVRLADGRTAFLKTRAGAAPGEFAAEAAGLAWLAEPGGLRVPEVLHVAGDHLLLEWIPEGRLDPAGEEALGRGLAVVHAAGADAVGAVPGGAGVIRLGPLVVPSPSGGAWPAFYAEHRLLAVLPHARLPAAGRRAVETVCERIADLAGPAEPPARLHGDLWTGNVLAGRDGRPSLIDPAAYGGHREVDLAMLQLFGAPSPRMLAAYAEVTPPAAGHEERRALWQLFPLLAHAALFGGSYGAAAERAARRYC